jgi:hypothetical protein
VSGTEIARGLLRDASKRRLHASWRATAHHNSLLPDIFLLESEGNYTRLHFGSERYREGQKTATGCILNTTWESKMEIPAA